MRTEAIGQLVVLAGMHLSDVELETWVTEKGSYFVPRDPGAVRGWLIRVRVRETLVANAAARMTDPDRS